MNENKNRRSARHPLLTGLRYDVYAFIEANPGCSRADVARGLKLSSSSATARIKELLDEGLIMEPAGVTKRNSYGTRVRCLTISDRGEGSAPLDRVRVRVTLTIDYNGNYGVTAEVIDGNVQVGHAAPILRKDITLTAPPRQSFETALNTEEVVPISAAELRADAELIIDGVAVIVEED